MATNKDKKSNKKSGKKKDAESFEARQRVELDAGKKLTTRTSPSLSENRKSE